MNWNRSLAAIATLCSLTINAWPADKAATPRPNIIVILSDDMGFSDLGCYGGEIKTPNLDALAADGIRLTQFYNTARCCPTRASLLTGLYPHQAGMGHMTEDHGTPGYQGDLNNRCATIAEVLNDGGYSTYAIGKWHVSREARPNGPQHNWPLQRGFDKYYGTIWGAASYFDPGICRGNTWYSKDNDPDYKSDNYYFTNALSDNAVTFIKDHEKESPDKPFFMYVAYTAAHWPMMALEKDIAKYKGRFDAGYDKLRKQRYERMKEMGLIDEKWELSPTAKSWDDVKNREWELRCMEVYAAMIDCMDQGIGQIVTELKRQDKFDNTIIMFMQDNGGCAEEIGRQPRKADPKKKPRVLRPDEMPVGGGHPTQTRDGRPMRSGPDVMPGKADTYLGYGLGWANVSDTPFREYKHWVHEGGISTPLIVHWPDGIAKPHRNTLASDPAHLIDIMATCVDVAGTSYPAERKGQKIVPMQGVSLRSLFKGEHLSRAEPIFWEHEGNRAVREGKWKLVAKEDKPWELYDMEADRTEMHDLAAANPERVKEMSAQWDAYAARCDVLPLGGWKKKLDGDTTGTKAKPSSVTLNDGETLPGDKSPSVGDCALTVTAELIKAKGDGILAAQGGKAHGYALYVQDGKLRFDVRRSSELKTVSAKTVLSGSARRVAASIVAKGDVRLLVDGKEIATEKGIGTLVKTPADGLSAGHDSGDPVGDYDGEFAYGGKLKSITVEIGAAN